MIVRLLENLEKIGKKGDIAEVSAGFFRNYLQPRKYAIIELKTLILSARVKPAFAPSARDNQTNQNKSKKLSKADKRKIRQAQK